jgi:hypothetical protein
MAAADQRNLTTNTSIAAEGRMSGECVRKLAQTHDVLARTVHAALMRT